MDNVKILNDWVAIYKEFSKKFFDNDDISYAEAWPPPHIESDIEVVLIKEMGTKEDIFALPLIANADPRIKKSIDGMIRSAEKSVAVRKDWRAALRSVKKGTDLSMTIKWGLSRSDIKELARLHKSNKFRRKIEDLLEDCNFHTECADFMCMHYDKYLQKETA